MAIPEEEFIRGVADWDVYPVSVEGKAVGAVLMRGEEIHACIKDGFGKWLTKAVLRNTLWKILKVHGRAITSVKTGNEVGASFVKRLGFSPIQEKEGVTIWELKRR